MQQFFPKVLVLSVALMASAAWADTRTAVASNELGMETSLGCDAAVPLVFAASDEVAGSGARGSCTSEATCGNGASVSCTGQSSCSAGVDSSCPFQRGYAECDGTRTWCPPCNISETCQQGAACGGLVGCGIGSTHPGVCYQGGCRCWCSEGESCSQDSDCGPANTPGVCSGGVCFCL